MTEILLAIICGLIAMLSWGIADFLAKKSIDDIGDFATLFWGHLVGSLMYLSILCGRVFKYHAKAQYPKDYNEWIMLTGFGVIQAVIYILLYRGFGKGQLSILNPIFASYTGLTVLISLLFFNETLTMYLCIPLILIFIGIILMNVDIKALYKRKIAFIKTPGLIEIIIATILAAVWTIYWADFVHHRDAFTYSFYMYLIMTIVITIVCLFKRIKFTIVNESTFYICCCIGFFENAAYLAVSTGYRWTHYTSIIALLSGAFSLPVVFLSRIFLWEIPTKVQYVGIGLIILSIVLLSLT